MVCLHGMNRDKFTITISFAYTVSHPSKYVTDYMMSHFRNQCLQQKLSVATTYQLSVNKNSEVNTDCDVLL